jgi:hypothetical protein
MIHMFFEVICDGTSCYVIHGGGGGRNGKKKMLRDFVHMKYDISSLDS